MGRQNVEEEDLLRPRLVKSEPDSGFAEGISFQEGTKTKNHVSSSHT